MTEKQPSIFMIDLNFFWCSLDYYIGNEFKHYRRLRKKKEHCVHLDFVLSNFKTLHLMLSWSYWQCRLWTGNLSPLYFCLTSTSLAASSPPDKAGSSENYLNFMLWLALLEPKPKRFWVKYGKFYFIFCVIFVHLSLSDLYFSHVLFYALIFLCPPVFVEMYTTALVSFFFLHYLVWLRSLFDLTIFFVISENEKRMLITILTL